MKFEMRTKFQSFAVLRKALRESLQNFERALKNRLWEVHRKPARQGGAPLSERAVEFGKIKQSNGVLSSLKMPLKKISKGAFLMHMRRHLLGLERGRKKSSQFDN